MLVAVPLFVGLGDLCIRIWDEGRIAVNALEMSESGNLVVTTFHGKPDHWNLKPPMLIWLQALCIELIGPTEWAIRLPSAISAFLTCGLLAWFSKRYLNSFWFGAIACLVLVTSPGFVGIHTSRTGDYDALLTLLLTLGNLCFFLFIQERSKSFLGWFFLAMTMAFLTKSIAAFLFLPALVIYTYLNHRITPILRSPSFYFGIIIFLFVVGGYLFLREKMDTGYLQALWENDGGGRYLNENQVNQTDHWFYLKHINDQGFIVWNAFFPVCALITLLFGNAKTKRLLGYSLLLIVIHLAVISSSQTRYHWYSCPEFPFMAIVVALGIFTVLERFRKAEYLRYHKVIYGLALIALIPVFRTPYRWTLKRTLTPTEHKFDAQFFSLTNHLRAGLEGKVNLNGFRVFNPIYQSHNDFYMTLLHRQGVEIGYSEIEDLKLKDRVLVNDDEAKATLLACFEVEENQLGNGLSEYLLIGLK